MPAFHLGANSVFFFIVIFVIFVIFAIMNFNISYNLVVVHILTEMDVLVHVVVQLPISTVYVVDIIHIIPIHYVIFFLPIFPPVVLNVLLKLHLQLSEVRHLVLHNTCIDCCCVRIQNVFYTVEQVVPLVCNHFQQLILHV